MNRSRMLILAAAAFAVAVAVTVFTYRALRDRLQPSADNSTQIVVAAQGVSIGARLQEADLRTAPWPRAVPMQGSFQRVSDVVGRGVVIPMVSNEPILESKLAAAGAGAGLMAAIPEGMRAISVKVNDVIGVAGFVVPGAKVDVILTGSPGGDQQVAKIVLQNVEVLAAGQNVDRDAEGKPMNVQVITLLVTPEDSEKLALVTAEGRLLLALRNPLDMESPTTRPIQRAELYSGVPSRAIPLQEAPKIATAAVKPPASKPAVAPVRAPAPPPPVVATTAPRVEPPPQPQVLEVQLIQGTTSQKFKFDVKPQE